MRCENTNVKTLKQEMQDLKEELFPRLDKIDKSVSYTNGKIAQAIIEIELGKQQRGAMILNCEKNHASKKELNVIWLTTITGILGTVVGAIIITALIKIFNL